MQLYRIVNTLVLQLAEPLKDNALLGRSQPAERQDILIAHVQHLHLGYPSAGQLLQNVRVLKQLNQLMHTFVIYSE